MHDRCIAWKSKHGCLIQHAVFEHVKRSPLVRFHSSPVSAPVAWRSHAAFARRSLRRAFNEFKGLTKVEALPSPSPSPPPPPPVPSRESSPRLARRRARRRFAVTTCGLRTLTNASSSACCSGVSGTSFFLRRVRLCTGWNGRTAAWMQHT